MTAIDLSIPPFLRRQPGPWSEQIIASDDVRMPGLYSMGDVYHRDTAAPTLSLSRDVAWEMASKSAAHAKVAHPRLNPDFDPDVSRTMDVGSLAHALLLGGAPGKRIDIVIIEADNYQTKAARAVRDLARARGKLPALRKDFEAACKMRDEARRFAAACEELQPLLKAGWSELSVFWREGAAGLWCRCRLDRVCPALRVIVNYKTSTSAHPEDATRRIYEGGYELQAVWHERGLDAIDPDGRGRREFYFLYQERVSPYACSLMSLSGEGVAMGREQARRAIEGWTECLATGRWPAYPPVPQLAMAPSREYRKWLPDEYGPSRATVIDQTRTDADRHLAASADGLMGG